MNRYLARASFISTKNHMFFFFFWNTKEPYVIYGKCYLIQTTMSTEHILYSQHLYIQKKKNKPKLLKILC